jgi:hypothetical protein
MTGIGAEPSAQACSRCSTENPLAARFCFTCGDSLKERSGGRGFAVAPNESVASFALVSTVMPYTSARSARTYKLAFLIGVAIPVLSVLFGQPSFALVTAAFVVPVVFIVYLYDVNLWEDQPVPVVLGTVVLSAILAIASTLLLRAWLEAQPGSLVQTTSGAFNLWAILIPCVIGPVIGVVLMLIGPTVLASRPRFDDLMDGLTFGVVAGVTYAAAETLITNWNVISSPVNGADALSTWLPVIINAAFLKPIVFGCAIGIAAAEFSGLGEGYDGFTGRFVGRVVEAMALLVLFQGGLYFTGLLGGSTGLVLGMAWALILAGAAILRLRTVLQRALLEGALEAAAREGSSKWSSGEDDFCAECEMPLPVDALFCVSCGASVRARSKDLRRTDAVPAGPGTTDGGSA